MMGGAWHFRTMVLKNEGTVPEMIRRTFLKGKTLLCFLSRAIRSMLTCLPVPQTNDKQGTETVGSHIPTAYKTARDKGLVEFIADAEQEAEEHDTDHGPGPAGLMNMGVQTIENCGGKNAVGDHVQQLVNPENLG